MNRVVITGMGVTSPVGNGLAEFWAGLVAGRSGIGRITLFDVSRFPVQIGGEVKGLDVGESTASFPALARERDRKLWLGLAAAREAIADAGAADLREAVLHVGVGLEAFFLEDMTAAAHAGDLAPSLMKMAADGATRHSIQTPLDRLAELIGDHWNIRGGRSTNCSACAAGAQAIGEAFRDVQEGVAEVALAGAADSMLNPLGLGGFSLLRILSAENDAPQSACRPFDATRQGTVLGEGAAFLVLESLEHAAGRSARIYAEIIGYGSSMDAYRVSDPEPAGRGAVLSMQSALSDAKIAPEQVDCVNAHGTGTPKNDIVESGAIKQVLGARARQIPVHAVKSMTGHMIAASGAVEAAAAAMTLSRGIVPPTINLRTPDPECDLDYVPLDARPFAGQTVLSNSFGFGGQNATLIFRRLRFAHLSRAAHKEGL